MSNVQLNSQTVSHQALISPSILLPGSATSRMLLNRRFRRMHLTRVSYRFDLMGDMAWVVSSVLLWLLWLMVLLITASEGDLKCCETAATRVGSATFLIDSLCECCRAKGSSTSHSYLYVQHRFGCFACSVGCSHFAEDSIHPERSPVSAQIRR